MSELDYKKLWITLWAQSGHRITGPVVLPETPETVTLEQLMKGLEADCEYVPSSKECELRFLKNAITMMPKVYRRNTSNVRIVQDFLLAGTSHAGRTSAYAKCEQLGIDGDSYDLELKRVRCESI